MKLLISRIFTFLLAFVPLATTPLDAYQTGFLDKVDESYSYYNVYEEATDENNYYSILTVKGICNDAACYGISFFSIDAGKYFLVIDANDNSYVLEADERNDSNAVCLKANSTYTIRVYDADGNEQKLRKENKLTRFSIDDYDITASNVVIGKGNGQSFATLNLYSMRLPFFRVLIIVTVLIIGFCSVILLLLFLFRRGLFNKDKRKSGVLNIKELLNEQSCDHQESFDFWQQDKKEDISNNSASNQTIYSDDDEIKGSKITNIKEYLQSKGFVTTYNILSEEEKNLVMLELMKLKNSGDITVKDYYEETYQLWKK